MFFAEWAILKCRDHCTVLPWVALHWLLKINRSNSFACMYTGIWHYLLNMERFHAIVKLMAKIICLKDVPPRGLHYDDFVGLHMLVVSLTVDITS